MSGAEDDTEKSHEPTLKKLQDARKKGEIARSTDLNTAFGYAGFLLACVVLGSASLQNLGGVLSNFLDHPDRIWPHSTTDTQGVTALWQDSISAALPLMIIPGIAVLVSLFLQRGFVVAPEKVLPKLSRISILANAKNKFGRSGLFEFSKSATKLMIFSAILLTFILYQLPSILDSMFLSHAQAVVEMGRMAMKFMLPVVLISGLIGVIDYAWQFFEHLRKNRMSHRDLKDEFKAAEGDPHVKQQRRQKGIEIALNSMLSDVPAADVIIVNPTHYAVALKWDRSTGQAPVCIAKGVDEIAARIREVAAESGVPVHHDPPTARALHATIDVGMQIDRAHYKAVAAAIRFAEKIRSKARTKLYDT